MAKKRSKKGNPEKERLEIKELKWNLSWLGILVKLSPLFASLVAIISVIILAGQWKLQTEQQRLETERQRQETITNRKREFASENPSIRIAAALALSEYPKEAIQVLIHSLGTIDPHTKEEDTAFTTAIKTSLSQIGKDAIIPLVLELRSIQEKIVLSISEDLFQKLVPELKTLPPNERKTQYVHLAFPVNELLHKPLNDINNKLKAFQKEIPEITDKEIDLTIDRLNQIRTSKPELAVANKNSVEILAHLLRIHHIERCQLSLLDLSGTLLGCANLSGASLSGTNLSNAFLYGANLRHTVLIGSKLFGADLSSADLSHADLSGADVRQAKLYEVKGFRDVEDFEYTNLKGVKGLSKEDLEHAKNKRAITD